MPLDPAVQTLTDQMAAADTGSILDQEPGPVRQGYTLMGALQINDEVASVEDRSVPGPSGDLPVRVYTPEGAGPLPGLVFFHGGGWTIGDLDSHHGLCTSLCARSGVVVVAVDYRLAPEHKFPAAVEDAEAAFDQVKANAAAFGIDPDRLAVGGDSAGGNLAAVVSQSRRGAVAFQLLLYPTVDESFGFPSYEENAAGPILTRDHMIWFRGHYLDGLDVDRSDPRISPINGDVTGVAPAFVMTAEFDPLRDEGEAYAAKLADAGVAAQVTRYDGLPHAFAQLTMLVPAANAAVDDAAKAVAQALS